MLNYLSIRRLLKKVSNSIRLTSRNTYRGSILTIRNIRTANVLKQCFLYWVFPKKEKTSYHSFKKKCSAKIGNVLSDEKMFNKTPIKQLAMHLQTLAASRARRSFGQLRNPTKRLE